MVRITKDTKLSINTRSRLGCIRVIWCTKHIWNFTLD